MKMNIQDRVGTMPRKEIMVRLARGREAIADQQELRDRAISKRDRVDEDFHADNLKRLRAQVVALESRKKELESR